jgi:hypothetical protein
MQLCELSSEALKISNSGHWRVQAELPEVASEIDKRSRFCSSLEAIVGCLSVTPSEAMTDSDSPPAGLALQTRK